MHTLLVSLSLLKYPLSCSLNMLIPVTTGQKYATYNVHVEISIIIITIYKICL